MVLVFASLSLTSIGLVSNNKHLARYNTAESIQKVKAKSNLSAVKTEQIITVKTSNEEKESKPKLNFISVIIGYSLQILIEFLSSIISI